MVEITRIAMEFAVGILVMFALFSLMQITEQPMIAGGTAIVLLALASFIAVYGLNIGEVDSYRNVAMMGAAGALLTLFVLFVWVSGFNLSVIAVTFFIMFLPGAILFRKNMGTRQQRLGASG